MMAIFPRSLHIGLPGRVAASARRRVEIRPRRASIASTEFSLPCGPCQSSDVRLVASGVLTEFVPNPASISPAHGCTPRPVPCSRRSAVTFVDSIGPQFRPVWRDAPTGRVNLKEF